MAATAASGFADDQEKAEKQWRMITAMSRDDIARSIINRTFADVFNTARPQLVAERKSLELNYGNLFLAHELLSFGCDMQQMSGRLRTGQTILQIANASRADWRRIAEDGKRMNRRISDSLYKHFLHDGPDKQREADDRYNPATDRVRADADSTPQEISKAQAEYLFRQNLATQKQNRTDAASSYVGQDYQQKRADIAASRGETMPGSH